MRLRYLHTHRGSGHLPQALDGMRNALAFEVQGFFVQPNVLPPADCNRIARELESTPTTGAGTRNLLPQPWCAALARMLKAHRALSHALPAGCVAVQCTLFAKSKSTNWSVIPHQDLSIPVASKVDDPSCAGWSEKEGFLFTQPPAEVLNTLVAVRVHLDACNSEAGPLVVSPGSHHLGRLPNSAAAQLFASQPHQVCTVSRGGALVMRPLLLHASSKAIASANRRVLHFLFGPSTLPFGLQWANAV